MKIKTIILAAVLSVTIAVPTAYAQIPVTDVASIAQRIIIAVENIAKLVAQIDQLKSQLDQMKAQYKSITGTRGMQYLLRSEDYSHLPTNMKEAADMVFGPYDKYWRIRQDALDIYTKNGFDPSAIYNVAGDDFGKFAQKSGEETATFQALQSAQYDYASQRSNRLKVLINQLSGAKDQKAVLDLSARIQAQETMLKNELVKMRALADSRRAALETQALSMNRLRAETGKHSGVQVNFTQ